MDLLTGGKKPGIPAHQIGTYECGVCKESGVYRVLSCVQFIYDRLDPSRMQPSPVTMYQCVKCAGFLIRNKDGSYETTPLGDREWRNVE